MNKALMTLAGAALLASTSLGGAQDGTTVVPAGQQSAPAQASEGQGQTPAQQPQGQAPSGAGEAATGEATADGAQDTAAGEGAPSGEPAAQENAAGSGEGAAAAAAGGGSDGPQMAEGEQMQVDNSPSLDTQNNGNAVVSHSELGKPMDSAGVATYEIAPDGTADWYSWRGYKKYGANCLQCHGPDGMGSSFAPDLTESLEDIDYFEFAGIVISGQQNKWSSSGNSIMPAWGEDPNVMCSLDAIYIYLRGRADGVIGRGEPKRPETTDVTKAAQQEEYDCLGF